MGLEGDIELCLWLSEHRHCLGLLRNRQLVLCLHKRQEER